MSKKDPIKVALQQWVNAQSTETLQDTVTNLQRLENMVSEQISNLTIKAKLQDTVTKLRIQFRTLLEQSGCHERYIEDYMSGMRTASEVIPNCTKPTMELYQVALNLTEQQNSLDTYTFICR